ncbi:MAG: hypothetical protein ACREP4_13080 [Stenotrophomonas sp.]|uniref:hypothetical protein n=1 Tax=Stenotrophomonas sp. TaxID=69392 RepID=UPI003D6CC3AE
MLFQRRVCAKRPGAISENAQAVAPTAGFQWPNPYVPHPIYSGLLPLFCGNALIVGDWRGVIAVASGFKSFWFKLRQEECFLSQHFGAPNLEDAHRTKLLIPSAP